MSTVSLPAESRTLFENVRWETYVALAEDRRGSVPRMTYDCGAMELMRPSKRHETIKTLMGRLVVAYAEAKEIDIDSVASTTFQRHDLSRGFEADESFYIEHAALARSKVELDLSIDPPPDLVVEVEITSSAIQKLELFAAMGIPEVWRHDGTRLNVFVLQGDEYEERNESQVLAGFPIALADSLVARRMERSEIDLVKEFRESAA